MMLSRLASWRPVEGVAGIGLSLLVLMSVSGTALSRRSRLRW